MPLIEIHLVEGRSDEQKRQLLTAVTAAVRESIGAPVESIRVWIHELRANEFMVAGELFSERDRRSRGGDTP